MIRQTAAAKVAIVGMACRFPASTDVDQYWDLLLGSRSGLVDDVDRPQGSFTAPFVPVDGPVEGVDRFDAAYFGISPAEAEAMDPQQRLFLEESVHALEHAGYTAPAGDNRIGVFCGSGTNRYAARTPRGAGGAGPAWAQWDTPAALALRVSYHLNLRGPSVYVSTLCSTALSAVHLARQSLLAGESDMCLAGAVTLRLPEEQGYHAHDGGVMSQSGRCRPFDAGADGTVPGSGVGIFVLKRLDDALDDGDTVHAVLLGSGMNNDGADRLSFAAPSVNGQRNVIASAAQDAGVDLGSVGFVEAHGTGTPLGDPVEFAALREAREEAGAAGPCVVGSVKSSVGHLDSASGAAGLLKAVLSVREGVIPATLGHDEPNPRLSAHTDDLHVTTEPTRWRVEGGPRRAGVTSLGVGGTNVHMIIEEPPARPAPSSTRTGPWAFPLSADSPEALAASGALLADRLRGKPDQRAEDVATTLLRSRTARRVRRVWTARTLPELVGLLDAAPVGPGTSPGRRTVRVGDTLPGAAAGDWSARGRRARDLVAKAITDDDPGRGAAEAFGLAVGALEALADADARPEVIEAEGLGEFAALTFAGVLSWDEGLRWAAGCGAAVTAAREGDLDRSAELLERLEETGAPAPLGRAGVELVSLTSGTTLRAGGEAGPGYLSELATALVMAADAVPTSDSEHPDVLAGSADSAAWTRLLAHLWERGADPDWRRAGADLGGRLVALPPYPFARVRHWLSPAGTDAVEAAGDAAEPGSQRSEEPPEESGTDSRTVMRDIWCEVLGLEEVSPEDNFFDVGGHSIVAAQILSRVRERTGVRLDLGDLMDAETLQEMTDLVTEERESARLYSVLSQAGESDAETMRL